MLAILAGYAVGSIPFALVVMRLFGGGKPLESMRLRVSGTTDSLRSEAVSATAVRFQLGARYGCMTSVLDMAKATGITLAFKLAYPDETYYLIASGFAVVGHIWPVFHRFRGGRGQSPIIGSLFVVDWPTPLIAYAGAQILASASRFRGYVARFAPMLIAAGWLYYRFRDTAFVYYALGLWGLRIVAMRSEIRQYAQLRRAGRLQSLADELALLRPGNGVMDVVRFLRRARDRFRLRRES